MHSKIFDKNPTNTISVVITLLRIIEDAHNTFKGYCLTIGHTRSTRSLLNDTKTSRYSLSRTPVGQFVRIWQIRLTSPTD